MFSIGSLKRLASAMWFANYDKRYHTKLFCMRLADLLLSDTETNIINLGWWKTVTGTFSFSKRPGELVTMEFYTLLHFFLIVQCRILAPRPLNWGPERPSDSPTQGHTGSGPEQQIYSHNRAHKPLCWPSLQWKWRFQSPVTLRP